MQLDIIGTITRSQILFLHQCALWEGVLSLSVCMYRQYKSSEVAQFGKALLDKNPFLHKGQKPTNSLGWKPLLSPETPILANE